jgi:hypothetical protein
MGTSKVTIFLLLQKIILSSILKFSAKPYNLELYRDFLEVLSRYSVNGVAFVNFGTQNSFQMLTEWTANNDTATYLT